MNKQFQGSKKQAKRHAFLEREKTREYEKFRLEKFRTATSIEGSAQTLGINLHPIYPEVLQYKINNERR